MPIISIVSFACLLFSASASWAGTSFLVKERISKSGESKILSVHPSRKEVGSKIIIKELPEFLADHDHSHELNQDIYRESLVPEEALKPVHYYYLQSFDRKSEYSLKRDSDLPHLEVRVVFEQGPPENRINLPILAEGYTLQERDKFFADAERITADLFAHHAFASYRELFNVYAIFVASKDSGVTDIQRKDTAFGLYRSPAGSKRGILPRNTWTLERAFAKAPGADYPIILVNDDFYGGLGGRYAITTRSLTSGSMVLRHELGHNFGNVGEEYDGGQVYQGANYSRSAKDLKWRHWIEGKPQVFETKFLTGAYIWENMKNKDIHVDFNFPQGDYILDLKVSSVGWSHPKEVDSFLSGQELELEGLYTKDRSFFFPKNFQKLAPGKHRLSFYDRSKDGDNVFAFAMVYAQPRNLVTTPGFHGAYAVYDSHRRKRGYRPTYETCIMRNMRSEEFCSADKENMWQRFLKKVSLLDSYEFEALENEVTKLRMNRAIKRHGQWKIEGFDTNGKLLFETAFKNPIGLRKEVASIRVSFMTPEVRQYNENFQQSFRVKH